MRAQGIFRIWHIREWQGDGASVGNFQKVIMSLSVSALAYVPLPFLSLHPFCLTQPVRQMMAKHCHHLSHHHSRNSPVVVDVGGCHCIAEVGPHLEGITNKSQLACNHITVHRSLSFLSPCPFSLLYLPPPPPPEAFLSNLYNTAVPWGLIFPFSWSSVLELL